VEERAPLQLLTVFLRQSHLAADFREGGDPAYRNEAGSVREIQAYLRAGIDGFFSDDPGLGKQALAAS